MRSMAVEQRETTETIPATRVVRGACPHDCPDTCATVDRGARWPGGALLRRAGAPGHAGLALRQGAPVSGARLPSRPAANTRCGASAPRAPRTAGSAITWDDAIGEIASRWQAIIAALRRGGHPALLLQRHARPAPAWHQQRAAVEPHGRQRAAALDLRRGGGDGGRSATLGARWAPDYADVLDSRLMLHLGPQSRPAPARTSCRCCARPRSAAPTSS